MTNYIYNATVGDPEPQATQIYYFSSLKEANRLLNYHEHSPELGADPEVRGITGNVGVKSKKPRE
jgi:hypothetical protein